MSSLSRCPSRITIWPPSGRDSSTTVPTNSGVLRTWGGDSSTKPLAPEIDSACLSRLSFKRLFSAVYSSDTTLEIRQRPCSSASDTAQLHNSAGMRSPLRFLARHLSIFSNRSATSGGSGLFRCSLAMSHIALAWPRPHAVAPWLTNLPLQTTGLTQACRKGAFWAIPTESMPRLTLVWIFQGSGFIPSRLAGPRHRFRTMRERNARSAVLVTECLSRAARPHCAGSRTRADPPRRPKVQLGVGVFPHGCQ